MTLSAGTRLGVYEVTGALGAGGMGEVYRARDTRLKREVAIKVLPEAFSEDPDRLARFQREAELLATLNHPNIAAVYGFEETPGASGIVLELVEGPTLADRIIHGALPLDEALPIARQIADALQAAHERAVIHRDLKPANIKVTPEGKVKVLDFGLAKLAETGPPKGGPHVLAKGRPDVLADVGAGFSRPNDALSQSPTMMSPAMMTSVGMILGTAAYMSPEQARGKPVDQRGDIWAFGCVLYEMLTGRQVFATGETVSDAVAAILTREPDWTALPVETPSHVRRLLRRCLEKDPNRRVHHIADARLELEEAVTGPSETATNIVQSSRVPNLWMRALPWTVAALALIAAGWALRSPSDNRTSDTAPVRRLELNLPAGIELFTASTRTVAVSADGTRLAFVGALGGIRQVYLRPLDQFDATPLRGSDGATACFFSPDGQSIGLVTSSGVLKTISLTDGRVATFTGEASFLYGAVWTVDDQIIFVRAGALWQVPRAGGTPQSLTTLGGEHHDTLHAWPTMLPDGKTMLFGAASGDRWRIDSLVLATGERRTVVEQGTLPLYAASGHLVFFRDGELLAAPFDAARVQVTGPAVQAIDGLPRSTTGVPVVDMSSSGTVVYAPTNAVSRLVWVSRQGSEQPLNETLRSYAAPRLAPDGSRVVVQAGDLWLQDLARTTFTRLTPRDAVTNGFPAWTPDGRRVMFRTPSGLKVQDIDGGSEAQVIAGTSEFDYPGSLTADGETLVFLRSSQETSFDIYMLPLRDPAKVRPVLNTSAYEGGVRLSPDGRWLTYISNESGRNEVYLRPFPGLERKWQISTEGGTQAIWNPNGKEIFYRNGDKMMTVEMSTTPDLALSPPRLLFEQRYAFGAGITIANFDVSRDGQRFIMVKDESSAGRLNVVLNWFTDLNRLAPASPR